MWSSMIFIIMSWFVAFLAFLLLLYVLMIAQRENCVLRISWCPFWNMKEITEWLLLLLVCPDLYNYTPQHKSLTERFLSPNITPFFMAQSWYIKAAKNRISKRSICLSVPKRISCETLHGICLLFDFLVSFFRMMVISYIQENVELAWGGPIESHKNAFQNN